MNILRTTKQALLRAFGWHNAVLVEGVPTNIGSAINDVILAKKECSHGTDQPRRKLSSEQVREIVDSDPVIRTYAACEFDELSEDGQVWIEAIANEVLARYGMGQPFVVPVPLRAASMKAGADIRMGQAVTVESIRDGVASVIPAAMMKGDDACS